MNLYEFEGKRLFSRYGIPVPESALVLSKDEPSPIPFPFVLKAQVQTGGRGKAGGIRVCKDEAEYKKNAEEILALKIKDCDVHGLLAEQMVTPSQEMYMSITLQGVERPTLIISSVGGVDIEETAVTDPDKIVKMEIDPFTRLKGYQMRTIASKLGYPNTKELTAFINKVQNAFFESQAMLVEINPLGVVDDKLIAMDSKFVLDNDAPAARPLIAEIEETRKTLPNIEEPEHEATTVTFVPIQNGDVALISDGAGPAILTLDLLTDAGGTVASFCELGAVTDAPCIYRALELTMNCGMEFKSLIIVLFGGFNQMDGMANGITSYIKDHGLPVELTTVMCGTNQEAGRAIMAENGLSTVESLTDAINRCVALAKGGK